MNRKPLILLLFLLVALTTVAQDTIVPQTFRYEDSKALQLDLYQPRETRPDSACVVFLFGGGFVSGSRSDKYVRHYCQQLAERGFSAVAIDYTLHLREVDFDTVNLFNMQGVFRDAINITASDCASAIDFICRHATEWGVAPQRIVLCGSSAGAIGVLQLDYCRANKLPPADNLPHSWKPGAVVAYSGAVFSDNGKPTYNTPPAPTFFLHGTADKIVHYKRFPPLLRKGLYGAKVLQKRFSKSGYPYWIFRYEDIGHEVAAIYSLTISEFCAFVDAALSGRQTFYDATVTDTKVRPTKWSKMNLFDLYGGNN